MSAIVATGPTLIVTLAALAGLAIVALALLRGWQGWLRLKERELETRRPREPGPGAARIEMADLRERVRKLEAIAAGVDL